MRTGLSPRPVIFYITDRYKAVLLIWFSVFACFGVGFSTVFTFCVSRLYLVMFRLLNGHLLGESCSFGLPYLLFVF